ncbi:MAG: hypothetical protein H7338_12980 [Candidatus Sericytochromatia bacterium]|nr:hypothetical protein [Candidatus Sericytochromatia bacterium]
MAIGHEYAAMNSAAAYENGTEKTKAKGQTDANSATSDLATATDTRTTGKASEGLDVAEQYMSSVADCAKHKKYAQEVNNLILFGKTALDAQAALSGIG